MIVKSLTWCSVTVVAVLAAALVATAPVSAHSDNGYQNTHNKTQKHHSDKDNFDVHVETGACVFLGDDEGTIGVDITNNTGRAHTYDVTVNGETKSVTVKAHHTEYIAFTELSIGDYPVVVVGPDDETVTDAASIIQCHEHEQPTVSVDACGCVATGEHKGRLTLTISNTNDYAVTYTVRVGHQTKGVFVDTHSSSQVSFSHLAAGDYEISISGDDCTHLCLHATVEQCPEEEPTPEQPGQGSGNPTPETPATPAATETTQQTTLPAELPDTSAAEVTAPATVVASAQTPKSVNAASLVLVAIGLPMIAAAAVLRRKQLSSEA